MKVAICTLSQSVEAPTGLLSYFAQLARFLPQVDPATEYHFVVSDGNRAFIADGAPGAVMSELGWDNRRRLLRLWSEHVMLGPWLRRNRIDLLYMANAGVSPLRLPRSVRLVQAIFAFHQLVPGEIGATQAFYRRLLFGRTLRRADRIVLNSEYSRGLLRNVAPEVSAKVRVIPHGRDERLFHDGPPKAEDADLGARLDIPAPFVLFVSQIYPYKDVGTAVEGFCRFVRETQAAHHFVLVGQFDRQFGKGEVYRRELIAIAARQGLADRLRFREGVPVRALRVLYRTADAYIQPSLAETFGRTSLEAMACGCPVVAARAAATPEIVADAGLYFEPRDAQGCADALIRLHRQTALQESLRARGIVRARQYSVANEVRQLAAVFAEARASPP